MNNNQVEAVAGADKYHTVKYQDTVNMMLLMQSKVLILDLEGVESLFCEMENVREVEKLINDFGNCDS